MSVDIAPDRGPTLAEAQALASSNDEAIQAWDGVLFDRFVQFREIVTTGLGVHGEEAMRIHPPRPGERVLDIGCGFGDTAQVLGGLVGPDGEVVGIDASARFIETARAEAEAAGAANVSFVVGDVQDAPLEKGFDFAFSRMGTMFFANPVVALRNVRSSLVPGGRLCMVVWRRKLDNEWMYRAETVVKGLVEPAEETDEPTCGPGPFSMSNADTVTDILLAAGYEQVTLRRCDLPIAMGRDADEAIALATAIGPAGEAIRLAGDDAERLRPQIEAALREAMADFVGPEGVRGQASTWIVGAQVPAG